MKSTLKPKRYRAKDGEEWLAVEFDHYDGSRKSILMRRQTALNRLELRKKLHAAGAIGFEGVLDISQLEVQLGSEFGVLAMGTGWHGDSFLVGPERIIGGADIAIHPAISDQRNYPSQRGSLEDWQRLVAEPALRSNYCAFSIVHALAAPLFKFSRSRLQEGAIFHIWASSSTGKTTAIKAALSVSRSPDQLTTWDTTDRGMQEMAAFQNGLQIVLDDTEKIDSAKKWRHLQEGIHRLTGGKGRRYSSAVKDALPDLVFDGWGMSSGPDSIEKIFADGGQDRTDGDRVRIIDLQVPDPESGGIWQQSNLCGEAAARASEQLAAACSSQHGTALVKWLQFLVSKLDNLEARVNRLIDKFVGKLCPEQGDVERRIAQKFGLVFAAGRLAIEAGVLPWSKRDCYLVVAKLYRRSREYARRSMTIADAAKRILKASRDKANFLRCTDEQPFRISKSASGFVAKLKGETNLFIRKERLAEILPQPFEPFLCEMRAQGIALSGHGRKSTLQVRVRISGEAKKARYVAFRLAALKEAARARPE